MNSEHQQLPIGAVLFERYRILSFLGRGGMGTVYLAEDLKLKGKRWAIKETVQRAEDYDKFIEEAEILVQLNHPHLPNIADFYGPDSEGRSYLVMDYIRGRTLEQCSAEGDIPYPKVLNYMIQLATLFEYLHSRKPHPIIYRDLKPGNVMIDEQERVRLIDFGIARHYKSGRDADTVQIGTIGFAAPEQFQMLQTDARTDLYALGAMVYYLLSRGNYYYAEKVPLDHHRGDLPRRFVDIIDKLLKSRPEERYSSAEELLGDLRLAQREAESAGPRFAVAGDRDKGAVRHLEPKLIVVGSLYSGAGSTFVGMGIARLLHARAIPHAYIENPTNAPDLFALLYGEKRAPRGFRSAIAQISEEGRIAGGVSWTDGHTEWIPLPPEGLSVPWTLEDSFALQRAVKRPILIYDVSDRWEDGHVQDICRMADEILVVVDTSPAKMYRPESAVRIGRFQQWHSASKSVRVIANRDLPLRERKQWLASLFLPPSCSIPAMEESRVVAAQWKGVPAQDDKEIFSKLEAAMQPLIGEMFRSYPVSAGKPSKRIRLWPLARRI